MKAAKLFGANDIRIVECDIPEINDDEILLKTGAAALCGTDLRMIANGYKGVDENNPLILGHEIAGTIERVGKNISGYEAGMRVALAPNMGCGICDWCSSGNTHICPDYQAFGINMDGGFAEYARIPKPAIVQGNVLVLDGSMSLDAAALIEPASCVLNGQLMTRIGLNDTVLIIGAGPIGIMHGLLARSFGAAKVYIRDLSLERMKQSEALIPGSQAVEEDDLEEAAKRLTKGRGFDVTITACPSPSAQVEALKITGMNGRILYFGGLPAGKDDVTLATNLIHYKQLTIIGSTKGNVSQFRAIAKMAAAGNLELEKLISKRYPITEFPEAVEYARKAEGLKTVIRF
jgi:L-iditol 2-dehydrogenase